MTEKAGPFDSANWNEDDWARTARLWAPDCVEAGVDDQLAYTAVSGLTGQLKFGNAYIHGFGYRNQDTYKQLTHISSTGPAGQSRNDLVVLHLDRSANTIDARLINGSFAVTPIDPVLVKDDVAQVWEMPLWRVNVVANALAIGIITDLRRLWIPGATIAKFFGNVTLDANGFATINHGLGRTPVAAVFTPSSPIGGSTPGTIFSSMMADSFNATSVRVRGLWASGAPVVGNVNFSALFA